jgi:cell division protein FtsB
MEVEEMKRRKMGLLPKIVVACLAIYAVVNLLQLQMDINEAKGELEDLNVKVERQKRENAMLNEKANVEVDDKAVADTARSELGYVAPGERIFVDISN